MADVITHASSTDRRWQMCKCGTCGVVGRCTPRFDFYAKNDGDPLECEDCFRRGLNCPVIDMTGPKVRA